MNVSFKGGSRRVKIHRLIPAFVLCLLASPVCALAQTTAPNCTAATLTGSRALTLTGRDVNASAVLTKTFQAVGTASFDGIGAVTLTLTVNTNIAQGVAQTWSGVYTLASSCVGTLTTTSGDSATFTLIAYGTGGGFSITGQDGTYALTGNGSTQPAACVTASVSGAYAFSGNGFAFSGGAVTGVNSLSGLFQFDGRGTVAGSWSVATSGTSIADTVTGHYAVTAQCTGTGTLTDPSGVTWALSFTVTSADAASFVLDIANTSTAFLVNGHSTFTNPGLSVTSAASGSSSATPPGSIFALYGTALVTGSTQANNLPLPTTLLSTSVTVNGEAVPLFYMSSGQINAQMPWDVQPGLATVVVTAGTGGTAESNSVAVTVPATATPETFVYGSNRAVVQNSDFSENSSSNPSKIGSTVVAYFDGGGPVMAAGPLVSGKASPNGLSPVTGTPVVVTVNGVAATVTYIGLTPTLVGCYQVNFVVPQVATGDRTLVISVAGFASVGAVMSVSN
jgi:uncharacterized protein (TIGR03437 family)